MGLAIFAALWIIAVAFPFNLVLVPVVAGGLALLLVPALGPILLVASVPVQDAGSAGSGITVTQVLFGATVAIVLLYLLHRREQIRWTFLLIPYALYLATLALSLTAAVNLGAGIAEIYRWTVPLIALLAILYTVRTQRSALWLVGLVGVGASTQAVLGGIQAVLGLGPLSFAVTGSFSRAFGTFGMPNTYGAFLELAAMLLVPVSIWSLVSTWRKSRAYLFTRARGMASSRAERRALLASAAIALWFSACAALSIIGVGISFSRGAWLGTAAGLVAMTVVGGKRIPLLAGAGLFMVVIALAAGGADYAPAPFRERFEQLTSQLRPFDSRGVMVDADNFAAVERMAHWQTGLAMFSESPILGVGAGNFNERFTEYAVHSNFIRSRGHAHNYYIHAAAETGLIGLAAYLLLIGTAAVISVRAARRAATPFGRALGVGATGMTVALVVHNLVENLHVLNLGILMAGIWALAIFGLRYLPAEDSSCHERTKTDVTVSA